MRKKNAVAILGFGESGMQAAKLLIQKGFVLGVSSQSISETNATWCRKQQIPFESDGHSRKFLKNYNEWVLSPGIKPGDPIIRWGRQKGVKMRSEIEMAAGYCRGPIVAVTGTNGKTTTATLLHQMVRRSRKADLCGNIGPSLSRSVLNKGEAAARVVEVSSFQLRQSCSFKPSVGIILNLTPNHLDWHKNLSDYYKSKLKLASSRKIVANLDDPMIKRALAHKKNVLWFGREHRRSGVFLKGDRVMIRRKSRVSALAVLPSKRFSAHHNRMNALAAAAAAAFLKVPGRDIQRAFDAFRPPEHRAERVRVSAEFVFINDSKSTTSASTRAALMSLEYPVALISGGIRKQKTFREAYPEMKKKIGSVALFGEAAKSMSGEFSFIRNRSVCRTLDEAFNQALRDAAPGTTVLFSPMCSSFDQYSSYAERGKHFKRLVADWIKTRGRRFG